jgi:hypothetical protein
VINDCVEEEATVFLSIIRDQSGTQGTPVVGILPSPSGQNTALSAIMSANQTSWEILKFGQSFQHAIYTVFKWQKLLAGS